jgi:glucose/arabinose dehydrogenase/regulation of enolase protein 1 (concanavalin A-like superfamily)
LVSLHLLLTVSAWADLPVGWSNADIGGPGMTGSAGHTNGNWTVRGGGSDIWGTSDQFHYAYTTVNGDGTIIARVTSLQNTDPWAKAGLMFRNSSAANSANASIVATWSQGVSFQWRSTAGGNSSFSAMSSVTNKPIWLRLVRAGSTFTGSYSTNGSTWVQVGSQSVTMNNNVLAGLDVTSHNNATLNTATYTNVSVMGAATNLPPQITQEPADVSVRVGQPAAFTVQLLVTAGATYQWYRGGTNIPGATSASYSVSSVALNDHGAQFQCAITNAYGSTNSRIATLTISTNGILREVYSGIDGTAVANLTNHPSFPQNPTTVEVLDNFEAPTGVGDDYGQRLRAFITPPTTGDYTFWIASDDNSQLFVSTDDSPANKQLVASVVGWTNPRQWTKYPGQQSGAIPLVGGQRYYIEALMKEGDGGDNLAVRWQLPNSTIEEPIPAQRLQVYQVAMPDSFTMRHGGKARVRVTSNDEGYYSGGVVQITTPPSAGTAVANSDGSLLYTHTSGQPASDSFAYRLIGNGVPSAPATVTVNFTSAPRFNSAFVSLPSEAPATMWQFVEAFPGLTFNVPDNLSAAAGISNAIFVIENAGRVWTVTNIASGSPSKVLYLDIADRVFSDSGERGATGVAYHPGFTTNGLIFVAYDYRAGGTNFVRLSKFTNGNPASEVVLLQQMHEGPYHDIDSCRFGPDGYLYLAFGDEGGQDEDYQNAQRITKDFYSSIIRIDVDKRPGNLEPNPDPEIPRDGGGLAYFSVPADNPFVGATSFNGQPVNPLEVRTEIYVLGFRNPWQFSFMPGTNKLVVADVGRFDREEISVLGPGENAGWSWREGMIPGPRSGQTINGAVEADAVLVDPVFDYEHGSGASQGYSITGGFVYQGTNYPDLNGRYIFGDFVSGNVWSIDLANPAATFTRLTGASSIVAFLTDPSNNDILLLQLNGQLLRLVNGVDDSSFPQTLTDTGFFADLADLSPNPGGEAYEPNLRFWSDYADKTRWFLSKNATDTLTWSHDGTWSFPAGMIWAKHFDLELDRGNPATSKRVETRFLVKTASGAYGVSYKWNAAGTEAFLVPEAGEDFVLSVTNGGVAGTQQYHIPSRAECILCHAPTAGSVLSFNTRQLNRDGVIAGATNNLLTLLSSAGYLTGLNENPAELPRHVRPDETQYSIESRVRSYLAVNCAYCHQPGGPTPASWDGRPELNLWQTHLINGLPLAAGSNPSHRLIRPGNLNESIVWSRVARTNSYTQMPPIATNEKDHEAVQLLADWILNSLPSRQDYDSWRLAYFGNLVSPQGERTANPDGDRNSNEEEFLNYSNPTNGFSYYVPKIQASTTEVSIELPNFLGRRITVETSTDLGLTDPWSLWLVGGNNSIPLAPGLTNILTAPAVDPKQFFKIRIEEE